MKILLTNDDGIYAEGIVSLAKTLAKAKHEIIIVAPDRERSAAGHSITINEPLRAKKIVIGNDIKSFKVNGTPADCVKLGIEKLADKKIDLVISGINNGGNLGYDVLYSGTVSAAIEAYMMGYPALAVSLVEFNGNFNLGAIFIKNFIDKINSLKKEKLLLNINIPKQENKEFKSSITCLAPNLYEDSFEERIDPMGNTYYWLTGSINSQGLAQDTDIWAVEHNIISITPLKIQLNDFKEVKKLKDKINF